ncbi:MAG: hypothetical protein ACT4QD_17820 [Acidobacteriota bacterium]
MATGRHIQLTKQVGEYLVAAEVCRRGFIATTFTGNVPHYDIVASNATGRHQAIQVKCIASSAWQADIRKFADVRLDGTQQIVGRPLKPPYPGLICVFVRLRSSGADDFFIMTWEDLQKLAIAHYRGHLSKHGGTRPKKHDSFHIALQPQELASYQNQWNTLEARLREDV